MIERRTFVWNGVEHPAFAATGVSEGPKLSLIAGVHGCEYSSIAAVDPREQAELRAVAAGGLEARQLEPVE